MIVANIADIPKMLPYVDENLAKALRYIAQTDFSKVENGEYEIVGRDIYAGVNTYMTEPKSDRRPEKHTKYIDVQLVARGEEEIFVMPYNIACIPTEDFMTERDVAFYNCVERNSVKLKAGDFAVIYPWEIHRPNCAITEPCEVQKIVVKIKAQ